MYMEQNWKTTKGKKEATRRKMTLNKKHLQHAASRPPWESDNLNGVFPFSRGSRCAGLPGTGGGVADVEREERLSEDVDSGSMGPPVGEGDSTIRSTSTTGVASAVLTPPLLGGSSGVQDCLTGRGGFSGGDAGSSSAKLSPPPPSNVLSRRRGVVTKPFSTKLPLGEDQGCWSAMLGMVLFAGSGGGDPFRPSSGYLF